MSPTSYLCSTPRCNIRHRLCSMQPPKPPSCLSAVKKSFVSVVLAALTLAAGCARGGGAETASPPPPREIAITIDDGPIVRPFTYPGLYERALVVDSLTRAARRFGAPLTLFVIGDQVGSPEQDSLLRRWTAAGAALANHTQTHRDLGTLSPEDGVREIEDGQRAVAPFARERGQTLRYFRYPLLSEGTTDAQRAAYDGVLRRLGLRNAPVSISNDDWSFDARYADLEAKQDWAARYEVGQAYLQHLREAVALWDRTGREITGGRPVRHVMLLHANRINRDHLGQILAMLRADGFRFVSLDHALADPVYSEPTTWRSANGVSRLEQIKQTRRMAGQ